MKVRPREYRLTTLAWNELYQDWLSKMVDKIRLGTNGLTILPGTIPVGGVDGLNPQSVGRINGEEHATGVPVGMV